MVGKYEPNKDIIIRFVVSAPSSYAYSSAKRFDRHSEKFLVPSASIVAECPKYNNWGYGLNTHYVYLSKINPELIVERYAKRYVFYLCGSKDNNPNDASMSTNCSAMLQGRHRLERMQIFAAFLENKYGKSIGKMHRFFVIPGVGHYGNGTMTSKQGLVALFDPIH